MEPRKFAVTRSDQEWHRLLTPEQYEVMRGHGTEAPGSCALNFEKRPGTFVCAGCDQTLFVSKTKFESGTGFNFEHSRARFETYAASAARFGDIVAKSGADALIANHTNLDGSKAKLPALAARQPGGENPYVIGNGSVRGYVKVAEECARAAVLREQ